MLFYGSWVRPGNVFCYREGFRMRNEDQEMQPFKKFIKRFRLNNVITITKSVLHCIYLLKKKQTPAKYPRGVGIPTREPI